MKRDIAVSGILGLVVGLLILLFARWLSGFIPTLVSGQMAAMFVFAIVLLVALAEMPMMVFALRKLSTSGTLSRRIISGIFLAYVSFASVYALLFILICGDSDPNVGTVLAALGLVRFMSGIFIK